MNIFVRLKSNSIWKFLEITKFLGGRRLVACVRVEVVMVVEWGCYGLGRSGCAAGGKKLLDAPARPSMVSILLHTPHLIHIHLSNY